MSVRRAVGVVLVLVSVVAAGGVARAQSRAVAADTAALIQLEKDWDVAFLNRDVDFVARVVADEFIGTESDGSSGDKAKELQYTADFNQKIDSSVLDGFTVRLYGETAIVWFTRHLAGPSQGRRLEVTYKYIDVFVWRDGRWQCVASQSAKVGA